MNSDCFDGWARAFSLLLNRRGMAGALGAVIAVPNRAVARKRKRKKKKAKFNDFGCVDVGNFCKNEDQCCSGICEGKKGKKKCKAHDTSTCQAGQQQEGCAAEASVPCVTSNGGTGQCDTTTGNAAYCTGDGQCFVCAKDEDCVPFCGPQAACIDCAGCEEQFGTRTACVGPIEDICDFPE